jgi:P-type conjugative transfer protein TrbL
MNVNLDSMVAQFYTAGVHYSAAIQPYAIKLFLALFLIDLLTTWIQFMAEGQLDPSHFIGRLFRHVFAGGFVYLMIVNGFAWMYLVIQSFSRIGSAISGLPALSPASVLKAGLAMTQMLVNSPSTTGLLNNLELAFVSGFLALVVGAAFLIVAVELMLTLVKAYLTTSLGVILLGFGGNRFTASAAEGYFTNVIRIGTRLLFFYAVLAVGMQMVVQWQAALLAACAPAPTAVSMIHSYYVPPSTMIVSACTGTITLDQMLGYAALAVVFATISVAVPSMAAELVVGTVGLAIAPAFEAAYTAQTIAKIVNPITQLGAAITGRDKNKATSSQDRLAMDSLVRNQQRDSAATVAASAATKVLNPNNGRPPGYNLRPTTLLNPDRNTSPIAKPGSASTVSIVQRAPSTTLLNGGKKTSA